MMKTLRGLLAVIAVIFMAAMTGAALAQQPSSVNPTKESVKEEQLLNALRGQGGVAGRISIPDQRAASLITPGNQEWSVFHQGPLRTIGVVAVLGMLAVLTLFYLLRGKIRLASGFSGQLIQRFGSLERFAHWLTAGCFIVLALSGLNLTFGKSLLAPLIGAEAFASLTGLGKIAHNYLAFPFMAGLALMFLIWIKDNIPSGRDIEWAKAGGGLIGKGHVPAGRFNGGQKLIFWIVALGGLAMSISGWHLLFPFADGGSVSDLQFWNMVHGIAGLIFIAVMLAHAYIGSVGMEGAFDAMGTGNVDLNWAKEHHSIWVEDELKKLPGGGAKMQAAE